MQLMEKNLENPAPVEYGSVSRYLQGLIHARWLAGFLNHCS